MARLLLCNGLQLYESGVLDVSVVTAFKPYCWFNEKNQRPDKVAFIHSNTVDKLPWRMGSQRASGSTNDLL